MRAQTTFTRLTSNSPAAIAIIQISGPNALDLVAKIWIPNQGHHSLPRNRIRFGSTIKESEDDQGESIVVCRTGDQCVELHCHGGTAAANRIVAKLTSLGALEVSNQEWLTQQPVSEIAREALFDLTMAKSRRTTAILLDQYRGALDRAFQSVATLLKLGKTDAAQRELQVLARRYSVGSHLIQPWRVVLAGPPNVGKSSLLNRLLGYNRAIVHEQAGTTRDRLCEQSSFHGWPIELIDGAGIREKKDNIDSVEAMGIEKSFESIAMADVLLLLVDASVGWTQTHSDVLRRIHLGCSTVPAIFGPAPANQRCTSLQIVLTKCDKAVSISSTQLESQLADMGSPAVVATSAQTGAGLQLLMDRVVEILVTEPFNAGDAVPFRDRHLQWIEHKLTTILE